MKFNKIAVFIVLALLMLLFAGVTTALADTPVTLNPSHVGVTNSEFPTVGECPDPPEGQEGWYGWHFIAPGNANFLSLTVEFETAGVKSANPFPGTVFVAHPDDSHAYIWTPTDDKLLGGSGTTDADDGKTFFNLSHVCAGEGQEEHLTVEKTANTSFTREHFWDIAKKVETENGYTHEGYPKVWLYTDGSGNETATWTVDVTYEGYEDSAHNVSGEVKITNDGDTDAVITDISDLLDLDDPESDINVTLDCGGIVFPYPLAVNGELTCSYSQDLDDAFAGTNTATVTTLVNQYSDDETLSWGDPTTEINATVTVKDLSNLFGEVELGTVDAPNDAQFTYTKDFAWADYGQEGCGDYTYNNTATIVDTGDSADATLKVNVQCFIYETAYAMADSGATCFIDLGFSNWGWTNLIGPGEYEWDLWAGAGQCDTSKGTLVGTVDVVYDGTNVTVTFDVPEPPYDLDATHVYVGYAPTPVDKKGNPTVAPGQYTNNGPFDGSPVYVIAHAVVGIPDPDFGP